MSTIAKDRATVNVEDCVEAWRLVWRKGILPLCTLAQLESLRAALEADDPRLIQGNTTVPPPWERCRDRPVEKCCAICWLGWQGLGFETVGEVDAWFALVRCSCERALGEEAAVRYFFLAYDTWEREEMRRKLLEELRSC